MWGRMPTVQQPLSSHHTSSPHADDLFCFSQDWAAVEAERVASDLSNKPLESNGFNAWSPDSSSTINTAAEQLQSPSDAPFVTLVAHTIAQHLAQKISSETVLSQCLDVAQLQVAQQELHRKHEEDQQHIKALQQQVNELVQQVHQLDRKSVV